MNRSEPAPEITAHVPAAPQHVHILRSVVAAVVARAGGSVDDVADLRLVVDEAAARLLSRVPDAATLGVEIFLRDGGLEVVVAADGAEAHGTGTALGWRILSTLADEAEERSEDARTSIRILKRFEATT